MRGCVKWTVQGCQPRRGVGTRSSVGVSTEFYCKMSVGVRWCSCGVGFQSDLWVSRRPSRLELISVSAVEWMAHRQGNRRSANTEQDGFWRLPIINKIIDIYVIYCTIGQVDHSPLLNSAGRILALIYKQTYSYLLYDRPSRL